MFKKNDFILLDTISCLFGWAFSCLLWLLISRPVLASDGIEQVIELHKMATFSPTLVVSAIVGAIGSYLAFGEDKKFPPSSASIGHVLLNFGAGLFLTRGSLELIGHSHSSDDVIVFTSFLWASAGYFFLRMLITVASSEHIRNVLPHWIAKLLGVDDRKPYRSPYNNNDYQDDDYSADYPSDITDTDYNDEEYKDDPR